MASSPKCLARPRFQLLLLMLLLGGGPHPKNSMAENEAPASPDASVSPMADGGSTADKDSGRADTSPVTEVECWKQTCTEKSDCDKKPDRQVAYTDICPNGYCFQEIQGRGDSSVVRRGCATDAEKACLKDKPGSCMKYDTTGNAKKETGRNQIDYENCLSLNTKAGDLPPDLSNKGKSGSGIRCVCNTKLCNERTTSESAGVKQLGSNVALLVTLFPLRTMLLVG